MTRVQTKHTGRRIGIVGVGKQGRKLAKALVDLGYDVVGACDLHESSLAKLRARHPRIFTTSRISDLVQVAPEVVVVATLAGAHLDVVRELDEIDVSRIFCEKPVASSLDELRDLKTLVMKGSLDLKVNHGSLWSPDYETVKERIHSERLGELRSGSVHFKPSGFGNMGCHYLAMVLQLLDTQVSSVESAFFSEKNPKRRAPGHEDRNGRAVFLLRNGVKLELDNLPTAPPRVWRLVFEFDRGRIEVLQSNDSFVVWDGRKSTISETTFRLRGHGLEKTPETAYRLLDLAISSLLEDKVDASFALGCEAVEGVIASHHCFARGESVALPLERGTETLFPFS